MSALEQLAIELGVEPRWETQAGDEAEVSTGTMLAMVRLLGAAIESERDADDALAAWYQHRLERLVEPVSVAWDDEAPVLTVYTSVVTPADAQADVVVECEDGDTISIASDELVVSAGSDAFPGAVRREVRLPKALPHGIHRATALHFDG